MRSRERPQGLWCQGLPGREPGNLLHAGTAFATVGPRVHSGCWSYKVIFCLNPFALPAAPGSWDTVGISVPIFQASKWSQEKMICAGDTDEALEARTPGPFPYVLSKGSVCGGQDNSGGGRPHAPHLRTGREKRAAWMVLTLVKVMLLQGDVVTTVIKTSTWHFLGTCARCCSK